MFTEVVVDDVGRCYFAALYRSGCLAALPWGGQPFDCVVFLCDHAQAQVARVELSCELARTNVDWVQVAGSGAEELHDTVDRASVTVGRQRAVGDGSPMTSWHEDARAVDEMADVAALCFGVHERVLVLVVGQEKDLLASVSAVRSRLTSLWT